jgi:hypothetical protein
MKKSVLSLVILLSDRNSGTQGLTTAIFKTGCNSIPFFAISVAA